MIINELKLLLTETFTFSCFIFASINDNKIGSFFKLKEKIPDLLRTSLIYTYKCTNCQVSYVGQTGLQLKMRISKHMGISHRTGFPLSSPENSAIREHSNNTGHQISTEGFEILTSASNLTDRRILESLYIKNLRPTLNGDNSSIPLFKSLSTFL